jgi:sugar-specific transcriptional regulator TrmB
MLERLGSEIGHRLKLAKTAMKDLQEEPTGERLWNIRGHEAIMARAIGLIDDARSRLLLGLWSPEAQELSDALTRAAARGVEVTTLCLQGCADECGGCRGEIYRYRLVDGERERPLVLISDDQHLLLGQVRSDGSAEGALVTMDVFVSVARQYLQNAIAVAEIVRSAGSKLPKILDKRSRQALEGAGLSTQGRSWIDGILSAVGQGRREKP